MPTDPKYLDKRVSARYLKKGLLDENEYERQLQALPDLEAQVLPVESSLEPTGFGADLEDDDLDDEPDDEPEDDLDDDQSEDDTRDVEESDGVPPQGDSQPPVGDPPAREQPMKVEEPPREG